MENKQTAVEFLIKGIIHLTGINISLDEKIIEQAKQMEKEQHIETWKRGSYSLLEHGSGEDFEQYYNETYGK